ncbi:3-methyladenine DNA glycosylase AlkD [Anaerovirgula multivorans]|uniref:3-methyladenine DNA glycosylase AlkD n=1 Tax=Anaerovirgula multivorans TaxID=312168 RepID=A0A239DRJ3_9FIRM|nr:DNA alkylation repair protein [Anaerovirgula multivorans]SNS34353.1 3-methyladenine DNA glycosylase AlkD [Anaerovirgula multivorans]
MYSELIDLFYSNRNQKQAEQMSVYMKNKFSFLGISKPKRAELQKEFIKQQKKQKNIDWNFVFMLWELSEREFQYLALDYLLALKSYLQKSDMEKIKILITNKAWWDSVDILAGNIVGELCNKYPELIVEYILNWYKSKDIWLVRTAILFQLKYKEKTDTELLGRIINNNNDSKEFFVNKAIGWALREYSKTNKTWVKSFLDSNSLSRLSVREASKYL